MAAASLLPPRSRTASLWSSSSLETYREGALGNIVSPTTRLLVGHYTHTHTHTHTHSHLGKDMEGRTGCLCLSPVPVECACASCSCGCLSLNPDNCFQKELMFRDTYLARFEAWIFFLCLNEPKLMCILM